MGDPVRLRTTMAPTSLFGLIRGEEFAIGLSAAQNIAGGAKSGDNGRPH
jgi:hypothetical protein